MTQRLLPGSARHAAAIEFGALLDETMRRRGVGKVTLRKAAGLGSTNSIGDWRHGRNLPTRESARRLAHALREPRLLAIVEEARRGACAVCGALVWHDHGRPTRYCSVACRNIGTALRHGEQRRGTKADREVLVGTVAAYRDAVAALCAACPDNEHGCCVDRTCPVRAVTPLRTDLEPGEATVARKADPYTPEASANRSAGLRRAHAERPGWAAANAERTRAMHAAMSPEQKAAWKRSISEARRSAK